MANILKRAAAWLTNKPATPASHQVRRFSAARIDRLSADWLATTQSINQELRADLDRLRARGRDLANNNDYARRFVRMCQDNIVGPDGIRLQSRVTEANGTPDRLAAKAIEAGWQQWQPLADATGKQFRDQVTSRRGPIAEEAMQGQWFFAKSAPTGLIDGLYRDLPALLADTLTEAAKRQLAASTLHQYRKAAARLSAILIEFSVTEVKPLHVATILDEYSDKPAWANILRTVLKLAMDLAVRRGWIDHNPVISIPRLPQKPRTRYLTDPEYHAIHQHANPTLRAIMAL
jgi:hypothetical protein